MDIFNVLKVLCVVAFFQVLLLAISLLKKDENTFNKIILFSLFVSFAIFLFGNSANSFINFQDYHIFSYFSNLSIFLSAPLLYFYLHGRLYKKERLNKVDLLHILPFVIILIFTGINVIYTPDKLLIFDKYGIALISILILQNIVYMIIIFIKLKQKGIFQKKLGKLQNDNYWLRWLFTTFSIILILQIGIFISYRIIESEICLIFTGAFFTITFFFINNLMVFGLSQSSIFDFKTKYKTTPIDKKTHKRYIEDLENALIIDGVYKDPLINLDKLSKRINIPKHHLSRIINENYGLSFNDLINQYRIEDVKKILKESKNGDSIIDIAYQVGYNSKSTFNTAFKKFVKMTPSAYLETIFRSKSTSFQLN